MGFGTATSCLNGHHVDPIARKALKSLSPSRVCPELMIVPKCIFFPQDHPKIKPKSIHSPDLVDSFAEDYMYLSCIKFINEVKRGPFGEHSPMLNDISAVPAWPKVNTGMIKMYHAEVLGKLPVIQHFLFGSILPFD